jgi:hypothetical protein
MRPATIDDEPQILEMFLTSYLENQKKDPRDYELDIMKVQRYLKIVLRSDLGICYIEDDQGFIIGEMSKVWFSDTDVANGLAWYIRPEHRGGVLALKLLRAFDKEAVKKGAKFTHIDLRNDLRNFRLAGRLV